MALFTVAIIVLIVHVLIAFWVSRDARSREMNSILWPVTVVLAPILGLVIYLIARQNLPARRVKWPLAVLVVAGVTLSGLVGTLQAQSLYLECASKTSEPEFECIPLDIWMIFLGGLYILMFLAIATPLVLAATTYFRSRR